CCWAYFFNKDYVYDIRPLNIVIELLYAIFKIFFIIQISIHMSSIKSHYLCISTEISNEQIFSYIFIFKILVKLNEKQLDDILELLMDGLGNNYKDIHMKCLKLFAEMALSLNERQLNNALDDGKIQICDKCAYTLAMSSNI
ncbi:hypothetical protein RFI_38900, partial [Reticulomyxa filosa]